MTDNTAEALREIFKRDGNEKWFPEKNERFIAAILEVLTPERQGIAPSSKIAGQGAPAMTDDQIKTLIHASKIVEAQALTGSNVEWLMSVSADLERIVWQAGYHCLIDSTGDLINNYVCICAAHSANECGCGAWDVPLPEPEVLQP